MSNRWMCTLRSCCSHAVARWYSGLAASDCSSVVSIGRPARWAHAPRMCVHPAGREEIPQLLQLHSVPNLAPLAGVALGRRLLPGGGGCRLGGALDRVCNGPGKFSDHRGGAALVGWAAADLVHPLGHPLDVVEVGQLLPGRARGRPMAQKVLRVFRGAVGTIGGGQSATLPALGGRAIRSRLVVRTHPARRFQPLYYGGGSVLHSRSSRVCGCLRYDHATPVRELM